MAPSDPQSQPHVYTLLRTDYLSPNDDEGHQYLISVHASLQGANRAAAAHVKAHSQRHGLQDANTNQSKYPDGSVGIQVIVGEEEYRSFEVGVHREELLGGRVLVDEVEEGSGEKAGEEEVKEEKEQEVKGKANGAAKGKKGAKTKAGDGDKGAKRGAAAEPAEGRRTSKRGKKN